MLKVFGEKIAKLIDVKTILTFGLVGTSIALAITGKVEAKEILILASSTVYFFFGVKMAENKPKE